MNQSAAAMNSSDVRDHVEPLMMPRTIEEVEVLYGDKPIPHALKAMWINYLRPGEDKEVTPEQRELWDGIRPLVNALISSRLSMLLGLLECEERLLPTTTDPNKLHDCRQYP